MLRAFGLAAAVLAVASVGCRRSLTGDDAGTGVLPAGAGGAATGEGVGAGGSGGAAGRIDVEGAGGIGADRDAGAAARSGCAAPAAGTNAIGEWATWPMPNPNSTWLPHPQTYTLTGDIVIDDVTGLVWQRNPEPGVTPIELASKYCDDLVYGGRDDWRLPRAIDLLTLIDFTRTMPALNGFAFSELTRGEYLSSTPAAPGSIARITVNTYVGYTSQTATDSAVVCVAGGCPYPTTSHYAAAGEVVRDNWTGLTWTRERAPDTYTLQEATDTCAGLTLDGGGWRIPSLNELQSLVDRTQPGLSIDTQVFAESDTPTSLSLNYWTSSPAAGSDPPTTWLIGFYGGGLDFADSPAKRWGLRCVRLVP
jgi:hypothetical protein